MDNKSYHTVNKIELYMITFGNHVVLAAISEQKVRNCKIAQIEHGIDTYPHILISRLNLTILLLLSVITILLILLTVI